MISLEPIGTVRSPRGEAIDDDWGEVTSTVELADPFTSSALDGIEEFSHAEIVFHFHAVTPDKIQTGSRHPRGNQSFPVVGIFAQRAKARPNRLGVSIVEIVGRAGRVLTVKGLDAVDGTPVIDIKPVMVEFLPRTPVRQPAWSRDLMRDYWTRTGDSQG